jgi:hypothetical protein
MLAGATFGGSALDEQRAKDAIKAGEALITRADALAASSNLNTARGSVDLVDAPANGWPRGSTPRPGDAYLTDRRAICLRGNRRLAPLSAFPTPLGGEEPIR